MVPFPFTMRRDEAEAEEEEEEEAGWRRKRGPVRRLGRQLTNPLGLHARPWIAT